MAKADLKVSRLIFGTRLDLLGIILVASLFGCSEPADERFTSVPKPSDVSDAIDLDSLDTIKVETLAVSMRPWPKVIRSQGSLEADQVTTVSSEISGRVIKLLVDIGDEVQKGEPLAEIKSTDYELLLQQSKARLQQAQSAVGLRPGDSVESLDPLNAPPSREAKAMWDESLQQVKRLEQLAKQNAVVATDLEGAIAAERVAEARYSSALNAVREKIATIQLQAAEVLIAEEKLSNTIVFAPIEGRIQTRNVAMGNYVSSGNPMFTIAVTKQLRYRSSVPERFANQLHQGQELVVTPSGQLEPQTTTITRIAPMLDRQNRSLLFEAIVDNANETIRPGVFAESEVFIDSQAQSLVLPNGALFRFAGIDKVWLVSEGVAREKVVQVGRRTEEASEILKGLSEGDVVIKEAARGRIAKVVAKEPPQSVSPPTKVSQPKQAMAETGPGQDEGQVKTDVPTASKTVIH